LHLIMKAPVWFIFDRLSGVIGGDGWHRSNIIDQFINSFGEWWLVGMPFENTRDWAATTMSFGSADITNYYVYTGISGGLISLLVFVSMLVAVFKLVGRGLQNMRKDSSKMAVLEPVLWGVSSAICAHIVNFTAVSYWDQSYVIWYLHLAIAVTLGSYCVIGQHDTMSLNRKSNKTLG